MKKIIIVSGCLGLLSCSNVFSLNSQLVSLKNPTKYSLELSAVTSAEATGSGGVVTQLIQGPISIEAGKTVQVPKGQKVWLEKLELYFMPNATLAAPAITLTSPTNVSSTISIDQNGATVGQIEIEPGKTIKVSYFKQIEQIDLKHKEFTPTKSSYVFDLATNSFK